MNFINWFLKFFEAPADRKPAPVRRGPKFVKGTQWTCPMCGEVLGVAKHDVYSGDACRGADWGMAVYADPRWHCGTATMRSGFSGRHEIHTPTGWVG